MANTKSHIEIIILDRLREAYKLSTDTALADFLGVQQSTVANWRKRGTCNLELIITKCVDINYNWLFNGEGPIWKKDLNPDIVQDGGEDYNSQSLASFESKAVALIDKIENGPWSVEAKLKIVSSLIRIVQEDLRELNKSD